MSSANSVYLGAGLYGSCCRVVEPTTREQLVIKTFPDDKYALEDLVTEATLLKEVQGPGVQTLMGVCLQTRQIVSHYAGVTAGEYFQGSVTFEDVVRVTLQISRTLQRRRRTRKSTLTFEKWDDVTEKEEEIAEEEEWDTAGPQPYKLLPWSFTLCFFASVPAPLLFISSFA